MSAFSLEVRDFLNKIELTVQKLPDNSLTHGNTKGLYRSKITYNGRSLIYDIVLPVGERIPPTKDEILFHFVHHALLYYDAQDLHSYILKNYPNTPVNTSVVSVEFSLCQKSYHALVHVFRDEAEILVDTYRWHTPKPNIER